ncbi:DUF3330 domain-containing protein [uncultured Thiohalocapsa sp.]|uniref:DUF3330 domain-containing protein n=1 Tax=uncultured Thiohalocapsa sp. TaxID=768990 RepID=UPI0025E6C824|nr:DUF3330 domain-containing protein [uncultured Thiohalocapsa sp.]
MTTQHDRSRKAHDQAPAQEHPEQGAGPDAPPDTEAAADTADAPQAAPGAPTAPAEQHREALPETLECAECRVQIPADEALAAEGQDYIVYFCSPECHAAWEQAHRTDAADRGSAGP